MLFCIANRNHTRHNVVNLKAKKEKIRQNILVYNYKLKDSEKKFVHCGRFWIGVNRKKQQTI